MQAHIAPLQPAALAVFPPCGSSQGAGRADLRCEISIIKGLKKENFAIMSIFLNAPES